MMKVRFPILKVYRGLVTKSISLNLSQVRRDNVEAESTISEENVPTTSLTESNNFKYGSNFVDLKLIKVMGGKGGDGTVSFHRDIYTANGPPDGGNGGNGGNVIIRTSENESTLSHLKYRSGAKSGFNGRGKRQHGSKGHDLILTVPIGTVVREVNPPQPKKDDNSDFLHKLDDNFSLEYADKVMDLETNYHDKFKVYPALKDSLIEYPQQRTNRNKDKVKQKELDLQKTRLNLDLDSNTEVIVAYGGRGGHGNPHFTRSNDRKTSLVAEVGLPGQVKYLELELKTLADCGLVGLPNAGKSTLLAAVSNAHPKIANYPFTTINPYLGTIDYSDHKQITMADIPGLIAGASRNLGLGHAFLRHIERSKVLVYVIDLSKGNPIEDFNVLSNELECYKVGLTNKPSLVIANKADLKEATKVKLIKLKEQLQGIEVVPVSAMLRKNILTATAKLRELVEKASD